MRRLAIGKTKICFRVFLLGLTRSSPILSIRWTAAMRTARCTLRHSSTTLLAAMQIGIARRDIVLRTLDVKDDRNHYHHRCGEYPEDYENY